MFAGWSEIGTRRTGEAAAVVAGESSLYNNGGGDGGGGGGGNGGCRDDAINVWEKGNEIEWDKEEAYVSLRQN